MIAGAMQYSSFALIHPAFMSNSESRQHHSQNAYSLLQSWYLARLRSNAAQVSRRLNLTPLSRIAQDARVLDRIVSEDAGPLSLPASSPAWSIRPFLVIWVIIVSTFLSLGFVLGESGKFPILLILAVASLSVLMVA